MEEGAGAEEDPALDVLSAQFDPLRALRAASSDVILPYPDVQACRSLDEYGSILRGSSGGGRPKPERAPRAAPPPPPPANRREGDGADDELVLPEMKQKPVKPVKSVLTFMQSKWIKNS